MHVISRKALLDFWRVHPDAEVALSAWYKAARKGEFKNLPELRQTFGTVDYVPVDLYVFNIGGNKYRLVMAIHFNAGRIYIRHVLTHTEYAERGRNENPNDCAYPKESGAVWTTAGDSHRTRVRHRGGTA